MVYKSYMIVLCNTIVPITVPIVVATVNLRVLVMLSHAKQLPLESSMHMAQTNSMYLYITF